MGRHRSTIGRELKRNAKPYDGFYRPSVAQEKANGRRSSSRKGTNFSKEQWALVTSLLKKDYSPEQVSGWLRVEGRLSISHETIYRFIRRDRRVMGKLWHRLRWFPKQRRKRRGSRDNRGRLAGKRMIEERPQYVEKRASVGHWEIDTVMDSTNNRCILTLVERATGFVMIYKLDSKKMKGAARATIKLIQRRPAAFKTITADNGVEFHSYKDVEKATNVRYYFANPYHSWERGTSENTNGLIRQYLPKRTSFAALTQRECDDIARKLNDRPRKRYNFRKPKEMLNMLMKNVALQS